MSSYKEPSPPASFFAPYQEDPFSEPHTFSPLASVNQDLETGNTDCIRPSEFGDHAQAGADIDQPYYPGHSRFTEPYIQQLDASTTNLIQETVSSSSTRYPTILPRVCTSFYGQEPAHHGPTSIALPQFEITPSASTLSNHPSLTTSPHNPLTWEHRHQPQYLALPSGPTSARGTESVYSSQGSASSSGVKNKVPHQCETCGVTLSDRAGWR